MKIIGVDPSSSSSGVAIMTDDIVKKAFTWERNLKLTLELDMLLFHRELVNFMKYETDLMVVEKVSVQWNVNTIRRIAYYEAAAMMAAAHYGCRCISVQATKARRLVFGKGNLSKEASAELVRERYPKRTLTLDECDAVVLGLAGPALLRESGEG